MAKTRMFQWREQCLAALGRRHLPPCRHSKCRSQSAGRLRRSKNRTEGFGVKKLIIALCGVSNMIKLVDWVSGSSGRKIGLFFGWMCGILPEERGGGRQCGVLDMHSQYRCEGVIDN